MKTYLDRLIEYYIKQASLQYDSLQKAPINDTFKDISVGDIIIAKRYRDEFEKTSFPEGHQTGPFIVIENNGDHLKAIYGTSNKNNLHENYMMERYTLESNILSKDTVFFLNIAETIDEYRYKEKIGSLNKEELEHFSNKLEGMKGDISFRPGLIVKYDFNLYYLSSIDDINMTLIGLKKDGNKNCVDINGITYEVVPNDIEYVLNDTKVRIIDIIPERSCRLIDELVTKTLSNKELQKGKRGDLINYNSNLYYVYGESGLLLNCFKVKNAAKKEHRITINGAPYEACFDELKDINSRSLYDVCLSASEEEMDYIKELKKSYSKITKREIENNKPKKLTKKRIKPGAIVHEKLPLVKEEYIVLRRETNTLYVIKAEDAEKGKFDRIVNMDIRQVYYVGTHDEYEYYRLCNSVNKVDDIAVTDKYLLELKNRIS